MDTQDKKNELLVLLSQTNDTSLIDEVYDILHPEAAISNVDIKQLPEPLLHKINKAFDDYNSGNYITHEEMKKKLQQWLTK